MDKRLLLVLLQLNAAPGTLPRMTTPFKGTHMRRRNSQFGVFFGHGSVGEHEASVGAEESAVPYRGHGAAARWPPAQVKGSGLQSTVQVIPQTPQLCRQPGRNQR